MLTLVKLQLGICKILEFPLDIVFVSCCPALICKFKTNVIKKKFLPWGNNLIASNSSYDKNASELFFPIMAVGHKNWFHILWMLHSAIKMIFQCSKSEVTTFVWYIMYKLILIKIGYF